MMERALDPARYFFIAREVANYIWHWGPLVVSPFLILAFYLAAAGIRTDNRDRTGLLTAVLALLFSGMGHFLIYVVHPLDLRWIFDSTFDRILVQHWPSVVFTVFLAADTLRTRECPATG
jgi:hypothetical protein